jgi:outer membrane protein assembly factor BamB
VVWTINKDMSDMASPLLSDGRIYFHKGKSGVLSCCDAATGKLHYSSQRVAGLDGQVYASPVAAGGYVYLTGTNGTTVVIKDSDILEVVATNVLGEWVGGTPAPVDNELFIRSEKNLYCISAGP